MAIKKQKKTSMKLRKRIRKTLGTVCLATALLVAAIPVPEASADAPASADGEKYTWDNQIKASSQIPIIPKNCNTIYTNQGGTFQFAYIKEAVGSNYYAVILGYSARNLEGNYLQIPNTVDAYTKFNENEGGRTGYVAVSKNQKPLYYMSKEPQPIIDVSGNNIGYTDPEYRPCYETDYSSWGNNELDKFYYKNGAAFVQTTSSEDQWIRNLEVRYIGNQTLKAKTDVILGPGDKAVQEWEIAEASGQINTNEANGIFAFQSNIVTLIVGDNLQGIGNYAFYNCTNLESISLGNGLQEIGKYAFANCTNMNNVGLEIASNLRYISDYTFWNCQALESFTLPTSVTMICDHAFDGCTRLKNLDIAGVAAGKNVTLNKIGYYAFTGCGSLEELVLPNSLNSAAYPVYLNAFKDCKNLKHVKVESPNTVIEETTNYKVNDDDFDDEDGDDFLKKDVHATFYFEGLGDSKIHEFTEENALAFKYADDDRYELIDNETRDTNNDGKPDQYTGVKLIYQVNSGNELLYFSMEGGTAENVQLPTTIGPYGISALNKGSFSGNCNLKKITIPATVTRINEEAFKGCHELKHVIFADASNITYIGTDAFATQEVGATCLHTIPTTEPFLSFTGAVGESIVPFTYAMSSTSNINAGEQPITYISYYSGWPTNLEIQYVVDDETKVGKSTLVGYPTYEELSKGSSGKYTSDNYPYITAEYEFAAKEAITQYEKWLIDKNTEVTSNQWDIINAALSLVVPTGVNSIETGLFSGVSAVVNEDADGVKTAVVSSVAGQSPDTNIKQITFEDIEEFEPYSFSGCTGLQQINIIGGNAKLDDFAFASEYNDPVNETGSTSVLETVSMTDGGSSVGDYAFCNNPSLANVTLSAAVSEMGTRPFKDCTEMEAVNFSGSPYFTSENAIIYGLNNSAKDSIVQCLESRGAKSTAGSVNSAEVSGVTSVAEEAFMDCTEVGSIDLSTTKIAKIPVRTFKNTKNLYSLVLPIGAKSISKNAFDDSNVRYVDIPSSVTFIDPEAFNTDKNPHNANASGGYNTIEFYCEAGSAAETYANEYNSVIITDKPISTTFKVIFWAKDMSSIVDEQDILIGTDAKAPDAPKVEGYRFTGWLPNYTNVSKNLDVIAQYEKIDSSENMVAVTFLDYDDKVLKVNMVTPGQNAEPPVDPKREGYTFVGWRPSVTNIQQATTIYAQYEKNDSTDSQYTVRFIDWDDTVLYTLKVNAGESAITPTVPGRAGYTFTGWRPEVTAVNKDLDTYAQYRPGGAGDGTGIGDGTGTGTGTGTGSGNGNGQTTTKLYTLTVKNGSGSGSYAAGSQPIIIADDPAAGMEFDKWTISPEDTKIASRVLTATVITMPEKEVTVTAHYKKKAGSSTATGSSNTANSNRPGANSGTISNGGTTVVIDKNGLSNTGVVSATVNGSSDDFVIKITDSASATEEIIKALMAEYGDISNIKYFPMDITLYDSTGKNKITDTTGLSISITLPLPDSMITYAGNNKVASVLNGKLDKLSPKFTTISGVSCVTFIAEHFSPYVIYVDTQNLTAGTMADATPKTGDGIHPKWFLSVGLACLSAVLFIKKDKRVAQKVRVRA